ncbi:MAG: DUF2294 domain-containing protein [Gemmataceae bacterium]
MIHGKQHKTKGELEADIKQAVIQFEKEYMGRGPLETHVFIIEDMVLVRLLGVLTPSERKLAQADAAERGRDLIKQTRQELLEQGRPLLEQALQTILYVKVKSLHTDISTQTGERIIVFTLEARPEWREAETILQRQKVNGKAGKKSSALKH